MAKKSAKSKGFRKQNVKKPYLSKKDIAILCVILAALAVGAFFLFSYDDGALKVKDGAVVVDGDNWLIVNGSNVRGRARYFKLGEMGEIDGYSREKSALSVDANVPSYVFTPAQEDDSVSLTVSTGHSTAEALAKRTMETLTLAEGTTLGELQTAELGGHAASYFTYAAVPSEAEEAETPEETEAVEETEAAEETEAVEETEASEETEAVAETAEETEAAEDAEAAEADAESAPRYSRAAAAYIDASQDSCVVILAESHAESEDGCLSDEALTAMLEQAAAAVTLEQAQ